MSGLFVSHRLDAGLVARFNALVAELFVVENELRDAHPAFVEDLTSERDGLFKRVLRVGWLLLGSREVVWPVVECLRSGARKDPDVLVALAVLWDLDALELSPVVLAQLLELRLLPMSRALPV